MDKENSVLDRLTQTFPSIDKAQAKVTARRIWLGVSMESFLDILRFSAEELGFYRLCTITGLDTGENFEFIYHIANWDGIVMNLKIQTANGEGAVIPSVLPVYAGATFYERELEGLLGVRADGLPEGRQYPLPDNWPKGQYPMRKVWQPPAKEEQST